jgi:hypothetical protein
MNEEIVRYVNILVTENNIIKASLILWCRRIWIYKTLTEPILCYNIEASIVRKTDEND